MTQLSMRAFRTTVATYASSKPSAGNGFNFLKTKVSEINKEVSFYFYFMSFKSDMLVENGTIKVK